MTTYASTSLTGVAAAQFDGTSASFALIQAICPDARMDPTHERIVRVPSGLDGVTHICRKGYWVTTVSPGQFLVLPNLSFAALLA